MSAVLLYIDDCLDLLRVRKANLERLGYPVLTATSAQVAMNFLEQMNVSVVLLDYQLEGLNTEDVALDVKRRYPHKPVLLLSAYCDMPTRILWLVDDYVFKGEPLETLVGAIERLTRSKGALEHGAVP